MEENIFTKDGVNFMYKINSCYCIQGWLLFETISVLLFLCPSCLFLMFLFSLDQVLIS